MRYDRVAESRWIPVDSGVQARVIVKTGTGIAGSFSTHLEVQGNAASGKEPYLVLGHYDLNLDEAMRDFGIRFTREVECCGIFPLDSKIGGETDDRRDSKHVDSLARCS